MSPEDFRRYGHELIDWLADYHESLPSRPVMAKTRPGEIRAALPSSPPNEPEDFAAAIDDLNRLVVPGLSLSTRDIVLAIWFVFIRTSTAQLTVKQHRWERTIAIEEFKDHAQEAWRDQVPAGASLPVCHRKQRSTHQVPDGEDCHTERHDKKDGTFEQTRVCKPRYRSEGVDDDWCTFTIRSWVQVDTAKAAGTGITPAWPANVPPAGTAAALGARRSGPRSEKLYLDFDGKDPCEVSDAVWRRYTDGRKFKASVRARSGDVVCGDL